MPDRNIIDTVNTYAGDIEETAERVKILKEELQEVLEAEPLFSEVEEAKAALALAKENLKYRLLQNGRYNELSEKLADEKTVLKDQKEILSAYLLEHFRATGERQILLEESSGDARELRLTGKLGKEVKYQTNLFVGSADAAA